MKKIDLHEAINTISDVVENRPKAIRILDQIYMKFGDLLLQAETISRWFDGKRIVFVGDGDAIALSMMHLKNRKVFDSGPDSVLVLDFDERVVNSINEFARINDISDQISAELYNVAFPLPKKHWQQFDAFYTNPPFGSSNGGNSIKVFMERGIECLKNHGLGCVVIADHDQQKWTVEIIANIQKFAIDKGFYVKQMEPKRHKYHLIDNPELTSCNILFCSHNIEMKKYSSEKISINKIENFYGSNSPLKYRYIKDLTNNGKLESKDYLIEELTEIQYEKST